MGSPPPASPPPPSPPPFPPPKRPPSMPAPPAPPATYEYHRCYLQVDGKKYVRLYSEKYSLLTTGTQGHCDLTSDGSGYECGPSSCAKCGLASVDPGTPGDHSYR